jgi:hypothetical protein
MGPLDPILDATSAAKSQVLALGLAHWTTQPATTGDGVAGKRPARTAILAMPSPDLDASLAPISGFSLWIGPLATQPVYDRRRRCMQAKQA